MVDLSVNLLWAAGAAVLGFGTAAVFAGILRFSRNVYLLIYVPLSLAYATGYLIWSKVIIVDIITNQWGWGLLGSAVVGAIAVRNVLAQNPSTRRTGMRYLLDLMWPGATYGFADAMLLSVLPVLAVIRGFAPMPWTEAFTGRVAVAHIALLASIIVTVSYHLGYPEFRNKRVWWTVLGNGLMSAAYLVTMNPLAAILPHIAMHIASITHGRETTIQLPPHYVKEA